MALDVTGNWVAGDDLKVIEVLGLPFGEYTLTCAQNCMNQLEDMSPDSVLLVKALLDQYGTAKSAQISSNLADTEGKTLVKADVLEWERNGASELSGPQQEMLRCRDEVARYFAFCSCMGSLGGGAYGQTALIRS